jgi:hypothetical protein
VTGIGGDKLRLIYLVVHEQSVNLQIDLLVIPIRSWVAHRLLERLPLPANLVLDEGVDLRQGIKDIVIIEDDLLVLFHRIFPVET